jgi:hypothetical protein
LKGIDDLPIDLPAQQGLVVVHKKDGTLVKGVLQWHDPYLHGGTLPQLRDDLHIQPETKGKNVTVRLDEVKAVFFVKTHEGDVGYDEVKFFADSVASELWVRVRLFDGERLEGRTENSTRMLVEPGFWLRPIDCITNNVLVYVPKASAVEFHVIGFVAAREQRETADMSAISEMCDSAELR